MFVRPEPTRLQSLAQAIHDLDASGRLLSGQTTVEIPILASEARQLLTLMMVFEDSLQQYFGCLAALGHDRHEGPILSGQECDQLVRNHFRDIDDHRIFTLLLSPRSLSQLRRFIFAAAPEEWHEELVWMADDRNVPAVPSQLPAEGFHERLRRALRDAPNAVEHFLPAHTVASGPILIWRIEVPHTQITASHGPPPMSGAARVQLWWEPERKLVVIKTGGLFTVVEQSICEAWLYRGGAVSAVSDSECEKAANMDFPFLLRTDDGLPPAAGDALKLTYSRGKYANADPVRWEIVVKLGQPDYSK